MKPGVASCGQRDGLLDRAEGALESWPADKPMTRDALVAALFVFLRRAERAEGARSAGGEG